VAINPTQPATTQNKGFKLGSSQGNRRAIALDRTPAITSPKPSSHNPPPGSPQASNPATNANPKIAGPVIVASTPRCEILVLKPGSD
jgi:hypothetical protein